MEPVRESEIAIAVLGASAALAAVLLVFVGLLFARADSLPSAVPDSVGRKFRVAAMWGLVPVVICAIIMLASYEWLYCPHPNLLHAAWRYGFWVETAAFVVYAVSTVWLLGR